MFGLYDFCSDKKSDGMWVLTGMQAMLSMAFMKNKMKFPTTLMIGGALASASYLWQTPQEKRTALGYVRESALGVSYAYVVSQVEQNIYNQLQGFVGERVANTVIFKEFVNKLAGWLTAEFLSSATMNVMKITSKMLANATASMTRVFIESMINEYTLPSAQALKDAFFKGGLVNGVSEVAGLAVSKLAVSPVIRCIEAAKPGLIPEPAKVVVAEVVKQAVSQTAGRAAQNYHQKEPIIKDLWQTTTMGALIGALNAYVELYERNDVNQAIEKTREEKNKTEEEIIELRSQHEKSQLAKLEIERKMQLHQAELAKVDDAFRHWAAECKMADNCCKDFQLALQEKFREREVLKTMVAHKLAEWIEERFDIDGAEHISLAIDGKQVNDVEAVESLLSGQAVLVMDLSKSVSLAELTDYKSAFQQCWNRLLNELVEIHKSLSECEENLMVMKVNRVAAIYKQYSLGLVLSEEQASLEGFQKSSGLLYGVISELLQKVNHFNNAINEMEAKVFDALFSMPICLFDANKNLNGYASMTLFGRRQSQNQGNQGEMQYLEAGENARRLQDFRPVN